MPQRVGTPRLRRETRRVNAPVLGTSGGSEKCGHHRREAYPWLAATPTVATGTDFLVGTAEFSTTPRGIEPVPDPTRVLRPDNEADARTYGLTVKSREVIDDTVHPENACVGSGVYHLARSRYPCHDRPPVNMAQLQALFVSPQTKGALRIEDRANLGPGLACRLIGSDSGIF
jgi:hypothetical protein